MTNSPIPTVLKTLSPVPELDSRIPNAHACIYIRGLDIYWDFDIDFTFLIDKRSQRFSNFRYLFVLWFDSKKVSIYGIRISRYIVINVALRILKEPIDNHCLFCTHTKIKLENNDN